MSKTVPSKVTPIKIGDTVSPIKTVPNREWAVKPGVKAEVLNIIDGVAMILPWNSSHECITRVSNLVIRK